MDGPPSNAPCESGEQASEGAARDWRPGFDVVQAGSGLWRFSSSSVADACLKHVRSMPSTFFCIEPHLMLGLGRPGIATASHEGTRTPSHRAMVSTPDAAKQGCHRGKRLCHGGIVSPPHGLHSATFIPQQQVVPTLPCPAWSDLARHGRISRAAFHAPSSAHNCILVDDRIESRRNGPKFKQPT